MTVTKTYKQLHAWMHLDHFSVFCGRSTDHHDLIHNGFLALIQAAATLKTKLKSGELVVGITGKLPFPTEHKEYFLRPNITLYSSVWSSQEHQASTYVTPVKKPVRILPETPLIPWRATSGSIYQIAPPYTLIVPPSFPEAMNMRLPEYSWAQGLLVVVHSLVLAYENDANCPSMTLARAAEKLDSLRRVHRLNSVPPAWYYLSKCRLLHSMDAFGAHCGFWMAAVCDRRALHKEQEHCINGRLRVPRVLIYWNEAPFSSQRLACFSWISQFP